MTAGRPIRANGSITTFSGTYVRKLKNNGFDINQPIATLEGDEVIVLALQPNHPFPLVGEVHDYNSNKAWLARWNLAGRYRGTVEAEAKHSLEPNLRFGLRSRRVQQSVEPPEQAIIGPFVNVVGDAKPELRHGILRNKVFTPEVKTALDEIEFADEFSKAVNEQDYTRKLRMQLTDLPDSVAKVICQAALDGTDTLLGVAVTANFVNKLFRDGRLVWEAGAAELSYGILRDAVRFLNARPDHRIMFKGESE